MDLVEKYMKPTRLSPKGKYKEWVRRVIETFKMIEKKSSRDTYDILDDAIERVGVPNDMIVDVRKDVERIVFRGGRG